MLGTILAFFAAAATVGTIVAVAGGDDKKPERVPSPTPQPQRPPVTAIMEAPAAAPPEGIRIVQQNAAMPRTDDYNPWPLVRSEELPQWAGRRIVVRVWIASDWQPVKDRNDYTCGQWSFDGPCNPGTFLAERLACGGLPPRETPDTFGGCPTRPCYLKLFVRITVDGRIELRGQYPGKTHTGDHRGRDWDIVMTAEPG